MKAVIGFVSFCALIVMLAVSCAEVGIKFANGQPLESADQLIVIFTLALLSCVGVSKKAKV